MSHKLKESILLRLSQLAWLDTSKISFILKYSSNNPELRMRCNDFIKHIKERDLDSLLSDMNSYKRISSSEVSFTLNKELLYGEAFRGSKPVLNSKPQTILVEFSSPNIAKPFHFGHMRSTIIGNFISNLFKRSPEKHEVTRINYLGDWGTQFGYLSLGMQRANINNDELKQNPIEHLFNAYVRAHNDSMVDPSVHNEARQIFRKLEESSSGSDNIEVSQWIQYRKETISELRSTYARLGVEFDQYAWESDYRKRNILELIDKMIESSVMVTDNECAYVAVVGNRRVPLIKSDGTTMYLMRDCAALLDRANTFKFDRMLYIVENGQSDHFRNLIDIGNKLQIPGMDGVEHVKFGRIHGMSTRKGNVVFLRDILNEAQTRMHEKQLECRTTKVDVNNIDNESTSDILGISAVIVNDLRQRRLRDYEFDWDNVLRMNGDTGIKLQYTHCRLCSLLDNENELLYNISYEHINFNQLREPDAESLLFEMARYQEIIFQCEETLEPCVLVVYLFGLSNKINSSLARLNVKDQTNKDIKVNRLLLFQRAQEILSEGMTILGLTPLRKM